MPAADTATRSTLARKPPADERSRRNGSRSRGPRTPEGRRRSAVNATSHGLAGEGFFLLAWEDPATFAGLHRDLAREWRPRTTTERLLVERFAQTVWRQRRVNLMERDLSGMSPRRVEGGYEPLPPPLSRLPEFALLERYQARLDRLFFRCIATLGTLAREAVDEEALVEEALGGEEGPGGEAVDGLCKTPLRNEPGIGFFSRDQELAPDQKLAPDRDLAETSGAAANGWGEPAVPQEWPLTEEDGGTVETPQAPAEEPGKTMPSDVIGGEPGPPFPEADQHLAEDLGVAAGAAGERARLVAETLALIALDPEAGWQLYDTLDLEAQEEVLAAEDARKAAIEAAALARAEEIGEKTRFLMGRTVVDAIGQRAGDDDARAQALLDALPAAERRMANLYFALFADAAAEHPRPQSQRLEGE